MQTLGWSTTKQHDGQAPGSSRSRGIPRHRLPATPFVGWMAGLIFGFLAGTLPCHLWAQISPPEPANAQPASDSAQAPSANEPSANEPSANEPSANEPSAVDPPSAPDDSGVDDSGIQDSGIQDSGDAAAADDRRRDGDEPDPAKPKLTSPVVGLAGRTPRKDRTLEYWAEQLSNTRFLRRQSARRYLIEGGQESVPVLKRMLDDGDLETSESVISILAEIGETEQPWHDEGAVAALESIANRRFGTKALLADTTLKSFADSRGKEAKIQLEEVGVTIGNESVALGARSRERPLVRIDDRFDGSTRALSWLRWLAGYDCVILSGKAVRADVLQQVYRLPDLGTLILIDCELTDETMDTIAGGKRIDAMEFRYTRLSEAALQRLAKVRLRDSLYLLGTAVSPERVERLRLEMPGLEISLRRGGFLGVICRSTFEDYCEVSEVMAGSGADEAGLQARDIIIRIDDKKVTRFEDLQRQINTHIPGDKIAIRYRRENEEFDTKATLQRLQNP